jgi:release factor glutamine methyltransferase
MDQGRILARAFAGIGGGRKTQHCKRVSAPAITVRGLLQAAGAGLGGDEAAREAELLLGAVVRRDRAWLYAHGDDAVAAQDAIAFHALLLRRARGEPLAYVLGRREFWSLDLTVTPDVLIPRAETELLVEQALQRIAPSARVAVADLGTGSGAIALAIARERPQAAVLATDVDAAALAVARSNAEGLRLPNVEFVQGDWFAALGERSFDVIVSNPPYIAAADPHLVQGDLRFEPQLALTSGPDGLNAIRAIAAGAHRHLKPGGWLLFEHGFDQGGAARAQLAGAGFAEVFTARDLEGRERVSGGLHRSR